MADTKNNVVKSLLKKIKSNINKFKKAKKDKNKIDGMKYIKLIEIDTNVLKKLLNSMKPRDFIQYDIGLGAICASIFALLGVIIGYNIKTKDVMTESEYTNELYRYYMERKLIEKSDADDINELLEFIRKEMNSGNLNNFRKEFDHQYKIVPGDYRFIKNNAKDTDLYWVGLRENTLRDVLKQYKKYVDTCNYLKVYEDEDLLSPGQKQLFSKFKLLVNNGEYNDKYTELKGYLGKICDSYDSLKEKQEERLHREQRELEESKLRAKEEVDKKAKDKQKKNKEEIYNDIKNNFNKRKEHHLSTDTNPNQSSNENSDDRMKQASSNIGNITRNINKIKLDEHKSRIGGYIGGAIGIGTALTIGSNHIGGKIGLSRLKKYVDKIQRQLPMMKREIASW